MGILLNILGGDKFRVKDYAKQAKDGTWIIDPAEFYPAMIAHIRAAMEKDDLPAELIDKQVRPDIDPTTAARRYRAWAKRIPEWAWSDSLVPLQTLRGKPVPEERVEARAAALECARKWFTRALKNDQGVPLRIHILKDERYRLGISREFNIF